MEVKVCKNCKRLFKYIYGPDLCPTCATLANKERFEQKDTDDLSVPADSVSENTLTDALREQVREEESKFEQVRNYINSHPNASVVQIAYANGVQPGEIFRWIKDDRLEFSSHSDASLTCIKCGAKIKSGRICDRCRIY